MVHPGDQGGVSFLPDPENFKEGGSKMMKRLFCVLAIVTGLILAAGCGNVLAGENLSFSTFDGAVKGLDTPDKVLAFMQKNFSNSFHEGIVSYSPEEFFRIRSGDGKDYATFFSYILSRHDYEAEIVMIVWEGKDGKKGVFSTTFFKDEAGVKWFQANDKKSGPVTSLEDMLEKIDTDLKDRKVVGHWVLPPGSMDHRKPEGTAAAGSRGEIEKVNRPDDEIIASQHFFNPRIDSLPYRGATLFLGYKGTSISEKDFVVNIIKNGVLMQEDTPVEKINGELTANIIDLMYLVGDKLDFVIINKTSKMKYNHSLVLEKRFPWLDWMFKKDEKVSLEKYSVRNFDYHPDPNPNFRGAVYHSSWDFQTTPFKAVKVFASTIGFVFRVPPLCVEHNLEVYNPYVGAIVQYGHTNNLKGLIKGVCIAPGDHLANLVPKDKHLHFSIIRPFSYIKLLPSDSVIPEAEKEMWPVLYWPVIWVNDEKFIYRPKYYKDPYYWHEPTTLGYWNEETLPEGFKKGMLDLYQKFNSDIVLPAKAPLAD
jgi:hypothetical protein